MTESSDSSPTGETPTERVERNWSELLQEFRVIQTGTQILTGFLLTLPFQAKFSSLTTLQTTLYLGLVCGSALATALALAPVSVHRLLFRRGEKRQIVETANRLALFTLVVISLVLTGTIVFIFDVVVGDVAGIVAGVVALVALALLWVVLPLSIRRSLPTP
ncbi:MAG: sodium:proton antiporter [Subtercola sp.]|nr:sodium:proton antiporter [Subtercola sp.]